MSMVNYMSSPQPSEISERLEYFEEWLLDLSNVEDRKKVVDEATALQFIKETFNKDNSLANLRTGMDSVQSTYDTLLKGEFIKELIKENSGFTTDDNLITKPVPKKEIRISRETSLSQVIPKENRQLRRQVIERVYTPQIQERLGYRVGINKKGRQFYQNTRTGRFVSYATMMRFADPLVKSSQNKREEIERLLRLDKTEKK